MRSWITRLGKDSLVYGVGGVVARALNFFLLPVYTRIFAPGDYGLLELLMTLNGFLCSFIVLGLDSALSYFFFKIKSGEGEAGQRRVVSAVLQFSALWGLAVAGLTMLSGPWLNEALFRGELAWDHFALLGAWAFFYTLANQGVEVFRVTFRPWAYVTTAFLSTAVSAGAGLLFIVAFDAGIRGYLLGATCGSAVAMLWALRGLRPWLDFSRLHAALWRPLLRFGLPLVPNVFLMWVMNAGDRWFLMHFRGPEELGVYSVAAKFALTLALATATFRQAWWPLATEAMHTEDGPALFRFMGKAYLGAGAVGVMVLALFAPLLVTLLAAPAYQAAQVIVAPLSLASVFYGFFLLAGIGIWKAERTYWNTLCIALGAVVDVALNWFLVPRLGGIGAAIATSSAFLSANVMALLVGERLWPIGWEFRRMAWQAACAFSGVAAIGGLHWWAGSVGKPWAGYLGGCAVLGILSWLVCRGWCDWREVRRWLSGLRKGKEGA